MHDDLDSPVHRTLPVRPVSATYWTTIDGELLACLRDGAPMTPAELGQRLGMSAAAATSLATTLATEGKVRICLVALGGPTA